MSQPPSPNAPTIVKHKSIKTSNLSGLSIGEKAAIHQLTRLFAMPGLAGDGLRLLLEIAKSASVSTDEKNLYLLFLIGNAEAASRGARTP